MNSRGVRVDKAELIKLYDALDELAGNSGPIDVVKGLQMARECQHPDAVRLASLFPAGATVTQQRVVDVLLEQGDDPRAMWLAWGVAGRDDEGLLRRAAERGYARAQADLGDHTEDDDEALRLLEMAAAQNDRDALYALGYRGMRDEGTDRAKAIELFGRAAELNDGLAQKKYGELAFESDDWERYYWWGRAALQGFYAPEFGASVLDFLPSFEEGRNGRILRTMAPLLRGNIDVGKRIVLGITYNVYRMGQFQCVIELHDAMLGRARCAIDCWSIVGRRCQLVKDMRVIIAKMLWEEAWRWGEKEEDARVERRARRG
jgi:tetratricopeptide (TPR) repeat protein